MRYNDIMALCRVCRTSSGYISMALGVCLTCIREKPEDAMPIAMEGHKRSRRSFGLPEEPPKNPEGIPCNICVNECRISENKLGYCGLRKNHKGRLTGVSPEKGKLSWYHDPLPTNCVGDWVCPGGTGAGYPSYAHSAGPEYGYNNLAVFFHACSFDCLYCQNWHFREMCLGHQTVSADDLVSAVDTKTSCICYFGGDPTPQLPFALKASDSAFEHNRDRILRICWETNGSMNRGYLKRMMRLSLESGGCIKFDLKAWDENLHMALTGITNRRTIENFSFLGEKVNERPEIPLLIASTLLVPGYIDEGEIRNISRFIASISRDIPYTLLAFYPHFCLEDMPLMRKADAFRYRQIACDEGLRNVRIGNLHLLF